MGYGAGHTALALSASVAKQQPVYFEDERCSLVGDSFCICSFMAFAAFAAYPWTKVFPFVKMSNRLGLAPGLVTDGRSAGHFPGIPTRNH